MSREFYTDTSDSLVLNLTHYRCDNFVSEQGQIRVEQLSKRTRGLENRLRYRVSNSGKLALRSRLQESRVAVGQLQPRRPTQDEKKLGERAYEDFEVQHLLSLEWQWRTFSTGVEFRFDQQNVDFNISDSTGFSPFSPQFVIIRYNVRDRPFAVSQRSSWQPSARA